MSKVHNGRTKSYSPVTIWTLKFSSIRPGQCFYVGPLEVPGAAGKGSDSDEVYSIVGRT